MAADKDPKSLEMRVAELEDRVNRFTFTPEELAAYRKVSSALGNSGYTFNCVMTCWYPPCHPCHHLPCVPLCGACGGASGDPGPGQGPFGSLGKK